MAVADKDLLLCPILQHPLLLSDLNLKIQEPFLTMVEQVQGLETVAQYAE